MSDATLFVMAHATARARALECVRNCPDGYIVQISPPRRGSAQNALLHALLSDISGSVEWAGRLRDVETWKRLMTAAWLRARGESVEVLPALDGHGVDCVFRRTSTLTRAECAELVDYVQAWAAERGVRVYETEAA